MPRNRVTPRYGDSAPTVPTGVILSTEEINRLSAMGQKMAGLWTPYPKQVEILHSLANEILAAGSKGFGKTDAGQMWVVGGNPHLPNYDEKGRPIYVNMSYVYHPKFLGVVIRKDEKDLANWIMEAIPKYSALGMRFTKAPAQFTNPNTGAQIILGHAHDSEAWTKWQGMNVTRFLVEEAGQIPEFSVYEQIRSCCRSIYPELRAQILLTANPGGPGQHWLVDWFMEPKPWLKEHECFGDPLINPKTGQPYVAGEIVEYIVKHPFLPGVQEKRSRVWITGTIMDCPAAANSDYIYNLAGLTDEKLIQAYVYGNWKALVGSYFDIFSKPAHCRSSADYPLPAWWKRFSGHDWGYAHEAATYWGAINPNTGQTIIYDELVVNKTDPVELGLEIARRSLPALQTQQHLTVYISHDAYHDRIGDMTIVELLMKGVKRLLGEGKVHAPDLLVQQLRRTAEERGIEWDEELEERIRLTRKLGINFIRAPKSRPVGFLYMRSMMRLHQIEVKKIPDWDLARNILTTEGADRYFAYLKMFQSDEILPKLIILSDRCPLLVMAIPKAQHDEKNPETVSEKHFIGLDRLDGLRYLLTGMRDEPPSKPGIDQHVQRVVDNARARNPTLSTPDLITVVDAARQDWEESHHRGLPMALPRGGRRHLGCDDY